MSRHFTWIILIPFVSSAILAGCGTTSSVRVENVPTAGHVVIKFHDERPNEERISRKEESSSGAVTFYGDDRLSPAIPDLFNSYMSANLPDQVAGKVVKLKHFVLSAFDPSVSINNQSYQNAVNSVPNANPVGAILAIPIILGIESIKSAKTVSVTIQGTVGDKGFSSHCTDSFQGRLTEGNVRTVVLSCLSQFVDDIKAGRFITASVAESHATLSPLDVKDDLASTVNCMVGGERVWTKPSRCDP